MLMLSDTSQALLGLSPVSNREYAITDDAAMKIQKRWFQPMLTFCPPESRQLL